jgi:hypothetical protein
MRAGLRTSIASSLVIFVLADRLFKNGLAIDAVG